MLNNDYKDMLRALCEEKVKFLLVGAYAMAAHGYPRATMDMDIWVMPATENADAVLRALRHFGAPLDGVNRDDFEQDGIVFQIGVAPRRIDIITTATGLRFEEAYERSLAVTIDDILLRIPSIDDLVINKRATGRSRDLADVEALEELKESRQTE